MNKNRSNDMAARIVGFNYEALDKQHRKATQEQATAIRELLEKSTKVIVEIGRRLKEVRASIGPKEFSAWIKAEFRFSQSVASNYMRAVESFGTLDCLEHFQPSAIFDLGRENVPKAAVEQAIAEARSGKMVTRGRAMQIIGAKQSGEQVAPLAKDAIRRLRHSLALMADHVDALLSLPAEELDVLVDQLLSIATRIRSARQSKLPEPAPTRKASRRRPVAAAAAAASVTP
jgi:hypothetical protein